MDRMPTFEAAPATSLEIQPVEDMPQQENEKIDIGMEKETPFLPPKKAQAAKAKKPMTEKQMAHMERMRQRKIELQAARAGKKFEKEPTPNPPTKTKPKSQEEVVEEPKPKKPVRNEKVPSGKASAVNNNFENWLDNYEMMKKIEAKIAQEAREKREAEERAKEAEAAKERAMEERLRAKILAEQSAAKQRSIPKRWTPQTKKPMPATQGHLSTGVEDFGIYSNRYF